MSKENLDLQEYITEGNPHIQCPVSREVNEILNDSEERLEDIKKTQEGFENEQNIREYSERLNLEEEKVEESFKKGLECYIKSMHRINRGFFNKNDANYYKNINKIITSFTLNFGKALQDSHKNIEEGMCISKKTILNIASHIHRYPPNIITEIKKDYPDFEDWIITTALNGYSQNPIAFLETVETETKKLREKHPEVLQGLITKSVVKNPNKPEKFLIKSLETVKKLTEKYPEINTGLINHVTFNYKNPEKKLLEIQEKEIDLLAEYSKFNINKKVITRAIISYPENPKKFINEAIEEMNKLKKEYPDVNNSIIERAITSYSSKPREFINNSIKRYDSLKKEYTDVPHYILQRASTYSSNPKTFIQKAMENIDKLKKKYPNTNTWIIRMATTNYSKNSETFIKDVEESINKLTEKYKNNPKVTQTVIKRASANYPNNSEQYIKKHLKYSV